MQEAEPPRNTHRKPTQRVVFGVLELGEQNLR